VRFIALACAASLGSTAAQAGGGASLTALAEGRLIPSAPRLGGGTGAPFWPGITLGLDGGAAFPIALTGQTGQTSAGAGVRIGYQLANGLEPFARFDVLGVSATLVDYADLRPFTAGARYSIAFLLPTPFFEVMAGPALVVRQSLLGAVTRAGIAGAAGVGAALPLGRSFSIGLVARYWLADGAPNVVQTVTLQLSFTMNFGALFRK
jgi:hypothetical protein